MIHQRYHIKSLTPLRVTKDGVDSFVGPATQSCPKIYTVIENNKILYVGMTCQPVRKRLYAAINANGNHGYYGYKFKHLDKLIIDIWIICDSNAFGNSSLNKTELETIEAEVAFLVRNIDGNWPRNQNEIHFHESGNYHRKLAKLIFDKSKT